jgi:hypothetical protein
MKHFIENYSPQDSEHEGLYALTEDKSLIQLAIGSGNPEVVWMVLENKLSNDRQTREAWSWVSSLEGKRTVTASGSPQTATSRYEEIMSLLMSYGHVTPPPTPSVEVHRDPRQVTTSLPPPFQPEQTRTPKYQPPARGYGRGKHSSVKIPRQQPTPPSQSPVDSSPDSFVSYNGRGRGRGGWRARGRGRGRGGP